MSTVSESSESPKSEKSKVAKADTPVQKADVAADLHKLLWQRALEQSSEFIEANLDGALVFRSSEKIRNYAFKNRPKSGLLLEFGVFKGESINSFANQLTSENDSRKIYGFDSFMGLSENWSGHGLQKSHFNLGGKLPDVSENVQLIKGWVDDTLPSFLAKHKGPISFLHVDMDTYSPCKTILSLCRDRLVSGSVVLFDELLSYPGWRVGELKALEETLDASRYEWRAFAGHRAMLVVR